MGALHDVGAIDKQTMREFDDACLTAVHSVASGSRADPPCSCNLQQGL
jgi:DNA-binding transcriptional regulator YiaG